MSADPSYYENELELLKARLGAFFIANNEEQRKKEQYKDEDDNLNKLIEILVDYSSLVRQADESRVSNLHDIVSKVDDVFNKAVGFVYGDADMCDMMPSFAHGDSEALLEDKLPPGVFAGGLIDSFMPLLERILGPNAKLDALARGVSMPKRPSSWTKTVHPHPNTTPCSRFRDDIPTWSSNASNNNATAVYEARCDMSSDDISSPISAVLSSGGTCLAILSAGGYKNRTSYLSYYLPREASVGDFPDGHNLAIGLSEVAGFITVDQERKLVFVGDSERTKSYAWGPVGEADIFDDPFPTHTFDSDKYGGPMLVLPGGRFIRAGKGRAGIWDLDSAPTHGPKGRKIIGKKISTEDTWRDDPENIERSEGSSATSTIPFENTNLVPNVWQLHPTLTGTVYCSADSRASSGNYSCITVDLEHGGKAGSRYLGHGGTILNFSTTTQDPSYFSTSCTDGLARLYDVRHPLPVLTLKGSSDKSSACTSAVIAYPDGHPFIFTGYDRTEHIIAWDVRARAPIYDLSTGNNEVTCMEWNASENSLYAATTCNYIDRLGYHHGYRLARVPRRHNPDEKQSKDSEEEGYDEDEEGEDDDTGSGSEEYEESDEETCWPEEAYHSENYYGEVFDAGDHRIYRYQFKTDASGILPPYGQATANSDDGMW